MIFRSVSVRSDSKDLQPTINTRLYSSRPAKTHFLLKTKCFWLLYATERTGLSWSLAALSLWDTWYTWASLVLILSNNGLNQSSVWATALFLHWEEELTTPAAWVSYLCLCISCCFEMKSQNSELLTPARPAPGTVDQKKPLQSWSSKM